MINNFYFIIIVPWVSFGKTAAIVMFIVIVAVGIMLRLYYTNFLAGALYPCTCGGRADFHSAGGEFGSKRYEQYAVVCNKCQKHQGWSPSIRAATRAWNKVNGCK
jgi:hypothetical protein